MSPGRRGNVNVGAAQSNLPLLDPQLIVEVMQQFRDEKVSDRIRRLIPVILDPKEKDAEVNLHLACRLKVLIYFFGEQSAIIENLLIKNPAYRKEILSALEDLGLSHTIREQLKSEILHLIAAHPQYAKNIVKGFLKLYKYDDTSSDQSEDDENPEMHAGLAESHIAVFSEYRWLLVKYPQFAEEIADAIIELSGLNLLDEYQGLLDQYPQFAREIFKVLSRLQEAEILDDTVKSMLLQHIQYLPQIAVGLKVFQEEEDEDETFSLNKENFIRLLQCAPFEHVIACFSILKAAGYLDQRNFEVLVGYREFGEEIFKRLMEARTLNQQAFDNVIRDVQLDAEKLTRAAMTILVPYFRDVKDVVPLALDFFPQIDRKAEAKATQAAPVLLAGAVTADRVQRPLRMAYVMQMFFSPENKMEDNARRLLPLVLDPERKDDDEDRVHLLEKLKNLSPQDQMAIESLLIGNPKYREKILLALDCLADSNYKVERLALICAHPQYADDIANALVNLHRLYVHGSMELAELNEYRELLGRVPQFAKRIIDALISFQSNLLDDEQLQPLAILNILHRCRLKELLVLHPQYAAEVAAAVYVLQKLNLLTEYRRLVERFPQFGKNIAYIFSCLQNAGILSDAIKQGLLKNINYLPQIEGGLRDLVVIRNGNDDYQDDYSLVNKENFNRLLQCAPHKHIMACLAVLKAAECFSQENFEILVRYREFGEEILKRLMEVETLDQQVFKNIIRDVEKFYENVKPLLNPYANNAPDSPDIKKVIAIMHDFLPKVNREADVKTQAVPVLRPLAPAR